MFHCLDIIILVRPVLAIEALHIESPTNASTLKKNYIRQKALFKCLRDDVFAFANENLFVSNRQKLIKLHY